MILLHLPKKIRKFIKLSNKEKVFLFQAFYLSGLFRFAILFIPFKKLASILGKYKEETSNELLDEEKDTIFKVAWTVDFVCRNTLWESKCLVRALTAQRMLTTCKINSTIYLGIAKDKENENKLLAHAWLRTGPYIITGARERAGFQEVARFANFAGGKK